MFVCVKTLLQKWCDLTNDLKKTNKVNEYRYEIVPVTNSLQSVKNKPSHFYISFFLQAGPFVCWHCSKNEALYH